MSKAQRIINVIEGLVLIAVAFILIGYPEMGFSVVILVLGLGFVIKGLAELFNYFILSSNMVGGRRSFYHGIIILDVGLFTACLDNLPQTYVMLYLCGVYVFAGGIAIASAIDSKKMGSTHYKLKLFQGIVNILIGVACLVFMKSPDMVFFIYGGGILYNGIMRFVNAFKRNEIVYVQ